MKNCDGSECNYQACIDEAIRFIRDEPVTPVEFVIKLLCIIASILLDGGNKNANRSKTK